MKINAVLLWVIAILLSSLLALIMMILHGSIGFDSDWVAPSTIATLIGGLGGALAGTWLSGVNANNQWEKQERRRAEEQLQIALNKKSLFNSLVYAELKNIEVNARSMVIELAKKSSLFANDDVRENKTEVIELFYRYIEDISFSVRLIENAYKEVKALAYTDSIDYEIFGDISNVRVRTNEYYILSDKHQNKIISHLKLLEKTNPEHFERLALETMIGMNIYIETTIKINNFFIENEKNC
ncbi:hypothetical protein [Sporosarcina sp. YIM B06819]|uniref:hypothetical protein n=1 Tax=Sporosarcina sp. YIM B06819 TaxID=3081769 RepID=UPI00298C2361|nr:hypothetical protein [Sporosarcina sp. YIM B06819]